MPWEKSFLWAITQDGRQGYELPAQEKIDRQVEQYLSTLKAPLYGRDEIKRHRELGRGLYQTLVQPAVTQLQGKSKLIIVPDGNLYYLPFETLIADDTGSTNEKSKELPAFQSLPYLVKDYTVTYAPSASTGYSREKP